MLKIRQVEPQDIFSVAKIAHESLPEQYSPNLFNTFYETFPKGFLIAQKYQKIVGFLVGIKIDESNAKILMLAISKEYRRQGIGSALINKFLKEMYSNKIKIINLEVRTNNKIAIDFYKKFGFKIDEKIKEFYNFKEDAYIMKRVLNSC